MDISWVTPRIAVGGGIWNDDNMLALAQGGVTHVIDMQIEFDDTSLAQPYGIEILWNPVDDDLLPKSREVLEAGVDFALKALTQPESKLFVHCAAGIHRAPMMALAVLCALGWSLHDAKKEIQRMRPVVDFADVYVKSVENFVAEYKVPGR